MRKIAIFAAFSMLFSAGPAFAAVTVTTQSASLVTSPILVGADSSPVGLFSFELAADSGETLSNVTVTVNHNGSSTVSSDDIKKLEVYEDTDDSGTLNTASDEVAGSESTVNVDSATTVNTTSHNTIGTKKFFVALSTDSSWSGTAPADSVTVTLATDGVLTSGNDPAFSAGVTTSTITAEAPDTTGPELDSAVASNPSGTKKVTLTFDEETNEPTIDEDNIDDVLVLDNTHSWLDGDGHIGSANWSSSGKVLTISLSAGTSAPTVAVGDMVNVTGSTIQDENDNNADGTETITGSFTLGTGDGDNDDEDEDDGDDDDGDEEEVGHACANTLINGRLYKLAGAENTTVYLAAACRLKPFRGAAVFHARGNKFQNIIVLDSLPEGAVSDQPALPASGTLVKGSDDTVWFVGKNGKRKGFVSANVFASLGFHFEQINEISDDDLNTMEEDVEDITDANEHPDGSLVKCGNSPTVFEVQGNTQFPYTNLASFELRGHSFEHIATVDCGRFHYVVGVAITN